MKSNAAEAGSCFVNRDFLAARLEPQEIQALLALYTAGTISQKTLLDQLSENEVLQPLKLLLYDITVSLVSHCSLVGSSLGCDNPNECPISWIMVFRSNSLSESGLRQIISQ